MPSMPRLTRHDQHNQNEGLTDEVVLGVDTHKDVHVAAVVTVLAASCWPTPRSPRPPPGYRNLVSLGTHVGNTAAIWGGVHRFLRSGAEPTLAHRGRRSHRGQPARQGPPPQTGQDRCASMPRPLLEPCSPRRATAIGEGQ